MFADALVPGREYEVDAIGCQVPKVLVKSGGKVLASSFGMSRKIGV